MNPMSSQVEHEFGNLFLFLPALRNPPQPYLSDTFDLQPEIRRRHQNF